MYNPTRCSTPTTNCGTETTWGYTTYAHDALGRTTQVIDADNSVATTTYTGNQTTATDEVGNQRRTQGDGLGRLTYAWEAPNVTGYNFETIYQYDGLNNLTNVTQNGSNSSNARVRTFVYDSLARLTSATNPESGNASYTYDLNSNLATRIVPKAGQTGTQTITHVYTYDVLNRLLTETHGYGTDGTDEYAYDGTTLNTGCGQNPPRITATNTIGRRSAMCGDKSGSSWSFDAMGRPLLESTQNGGSTQKTLSVNYTYNKDGSLWTLTYPSTDVVTYAVGGAGRATQVSDSSNNFVGYSGNTATYAPTGALATMTNGYTSSPPFAGIVTSNLYNLRLQPMLLSASVSSNAIFSLCYDFHLGVAISKAPCSLSASNTGDNGNVFQIVNNVDTTRSSAYIYDPLNRIAQAYTTNTNSSNCWGETYSATATAPGVLPLISGIDAWGNLLNRSVVSGMAGNCKTEGLSATATVQNQLSGIGIVYDAAGNVTNDGIGNTPTYDVENRISTDQGYTYHYDADGVRMEKTNGTAGTMYWLGPRGETLTETSLAGTINEEYVYFNGERIARIDRTAGTVNYYFSNHLGSASVITSATGVIQEQMDFYPFGGVAYSSGNDPNHYKFTGKERDSESGFDNFVKRYFSSSPGRFMTPDAFYKDSHPDDPQSWNEYAYVRNNPLRYTDPTGEGVASHACGGSGIFDGIKTCSSYITRSDGAVTITKNDDTTKKNADGTVTYTRVTTTLSLSTVQGHEGDVLESTQETSSLTIRPGNMFGAEDETISKTDTGPQKIGVGEAGLTIGPDALKAGYAATAPPRTLSRFLPTLSADARAHPFYYGGVVLGGAAIPFAAVPGAVGWVGSTVLGGGAIVSGTIDKTLY